MGSPGDSDSKESACNVGVPGSIPVSRRSSGEVNGSSLQYSFLENSLTFFCLYLSSGKFSFRHQQDSLLISVGSNKSPLLGAGGTPECKVPPAGP